MESSGKWGKRSICNVSGYEFAKLEFIRRACRKYNAQQAVTCHEVIRYEEKGE